MLQSNSWGMSLYSRAGARKYLNTNERRRFVTAAYRSPPRTRAFCLVLAYTGCRISEALALRMRDIQFAPSTVSVRSLKKRGKFIVREIPIPGELQTVLENVYGPSAFEDASNDERLWPWGRTTGWTQVKIVMERAGVVGAHASPKGLRHGFGIHAVQSGVPLNLIQRWLGHSQLSTTAIYADAVGPEERAIAQRMW